MDINSKKILNEIVLIRILLILLLIVYHSFVIYTGSWAKPEGYKEINSYWWVAKVAYAGLLESFVFISGYLYSYQLELKGTTNYSFIKIISGKFKRLIIPSILFSTIYYYLFTYNTQDQITIRTVIQLISGQGHLWFLPMLFWCFVFGHLLIKFQIKSWIILSILLFISSISGPFSGLPLGIGYTFYFLLYYYLGFIFWNNKLLFTKYITFKFVIITLITFIFSFVIITIVQNHLITNSLDSMLYKVSKSIFKKLSTISYSLIAVTLIYLSSNYLLLIINKPLNKLTINISTLCFGVYIYQEFILKIIYYMTFIPNKVGPFFLPFFGLIITLILSLILSKLTITTRLGRFLIG